MSYFQFSIDCQEAPHEDRMACLEEMSRSGEVELPRQPPEKYRPLSWDAIRSLERGGLSFGPHTLTHPVLSTTSAQQSEREIAQSWERLRARSRVLCRYSAIPPGGPRILENERSPQCGGSDSRPP